MKFIKIPFLIFSLLFCFDAYCSSKVITVAVKISRYPFSYYEKPFENKYSFDDLINLSPEGFDVRLLDYIALDRGYKIKYIPVKSSKEAIRMIAKGDADMGIGAITSSLKRAQSIYVSTSYMTTFVAVTAISGKKLSDIKKSTLCALKGSDDAVMVNKQYFQGSNKILYKERSEDVLNALMNGECEAVIQDEALIAPYAKALREQTGGKFTYQIQSFDNKNLDSNYVFAINKEKTELIRLFDLAIEEMKQNGSLQRLKNTYLKDIIPDSSLN